MGGPNSTHHSEYAETQRGYPVVKPELGTKRTCPSCAEKFYDLLKEPIECPMCEFSFIAEPILPSKNEPATPKPKAEPEVKEEEAEDTGDAEVVSLEDLDDGDTDDEEDPDVAAVAEIEDVEIEDDDASNVDADKFLEEEEEGDDVAEIIVGGKKGGASDD